MIVFFIQHHIHKLLLSIQNEHHMRIEMIKHEIVQALFQLDVFYTPILIINQEMDMIECTQGQPL